MDWIAEKLFDLVQDVLKGDFANIEQLPALLLLILIVGCFLSRRKIGRSITRCIVYISDAIRIRKLEQDFKAKERRLRQAAYRLSDDIQRLEKYKQEFNQTRKETLQQVAGLSPPLDTRSQQVLTKRITVLNNRYQSSVEMVDSIHDMIDSIADISRGDTMNRNAEDIADSLVSESRSRKLKSDE